MHRTGIHHAPSIKRTPGTLCHVQRTTATSLLRSSTMQRYARPTDPATCAVAAMLRSAPTEGGGVGARHNICSSTVGRSVFSAVVLVALQWPTLPPLCGTRGPNRCSVLGAAATPGGRGCRERYSLACQSTDARRHIQPVAEHARAGNLLTAVPVNAL